MESDGLDYFGADEHGEREITLTERFVRAAAPLGLGTIAALLMRHRHPWLTLLGVSALTANVQAVHRGERTIKEAAKRMGRHLVASAGSLALPAYPIVGYVAGAFAGDLFFDGHGNGLVDEWSRFVDVDIDSTIKPDDNTKAIVVRPK